MWDVKHNALISYVGGGRRFTLTMWDVKYAPLCDCISIIRVLP